MECEICKGTGWILPQGKDGKAVRCKCYFRMLKKEYESSSGIPERYKNCKFSNFSPGNEHQLHAMKVCREFVHLYPFVEKGIVLSGPTGVGKTHLAVAILKSIIEYKGLRGLFMDFRDFLMHVKTTFDSGGSGSEIIEKVSSSPLLVLDDVSSEKVTDWAKDMLSTLINYRYINKLPTIITTNLSFNTPTYDSFSSRFDDRTESRIFQMCRILRVEGNDRRKKSSI